jgi:hypothetical protein
LLHSGFGSGSLGTGSVNIDLRLQTEQVSSSGKAFNSIWKVLGYNIDRDTENHDFFADFAQSFEINARVIF